MWRRKVFLLHSLTGGNQTQKIKFKNASIIFLLCYMQIKIIHAALSVLIQPRRWEVTGNVREENTRWMCWQCQLVRKLREVWSHETLLAATSKYSRWQAHTQGGKDVHWYKWELWLCTRILKLEQKWVWIKTGTIPHRTKSSQKVEGFESLKTKKNTLTGLILQKRACQLIAAEQEDSVIHNLICFPRACNFLPSLLSAPQNAQWWQTTSPSATVMWAWPESPTVLTQHLSWPSPASSRVR